MTRPHQDVIRGEEPIREYAIYLSNSKERRVMMLQFPHKAQLQTTNKGYRQRPLRIRIKPVSGLVEVDIPLNQSLFYDSTKAAEFAKTLNQSRATQGGGDHGLASGFGANLGARSARDLRGDVDEEMDEDLIPYQGLKFLTLGGRVQVFTEHDAPYMIGVFHDDELHLTKVDAVCSLRPQFHHLDALIDNEKSASRGGAGDHQFHESEARAVNMAVKSTDDEELDVSEVGKTLRNFQEEPWQHLNWVDEEDDRAFNCYDSDLQVQSEDIKSRTLLSVLTEKQYREAASAPRIEPMKQGRRVLSTHPWSSDDEDTVEETDGEEADVKLAQPLAKKGRKGKAVKIKTEVA